MAAAKGPILILHDTTEFSFQRDRPETIGKTGCCQVVESAADHQVRAADAFQLGDHATGQTDAVVDGVFVSERLGRWSRPHGES